MELDRKWVGRLKRKTTMFEIWSRIFIPTYQKLLSISINTAYLWVYKIEIETKNKISIYMYKMYI